MSEILLQAATEQAGGIGGQAVNFLAGNWPVLAVGIGLIIATVVIIAHLKQVIVNSVLGVIAWAVLVFVFNVQLPLIPSLVVSAIFGLAGIGVILILKFMNVPI